MKDLNASLEFLKIACGCEGGEPEPETPTLEESLVKTAALSGSDYAMGIDWGNGSDQTGIWIGEVQASVEDSLEKVGRFEKGVSMTVEEVAAVVGPEFKEMNENPPPSVVKVREEMLKQAYESDPEIPHSWVKTFDRWQTELKGSEDLGSPLYKALIWFVSYAANEGLEALHLKGCLEMAAWDRGHSGKQLPGSGPFVLLAHAMHADIAGQYSEGKLSRGDRMASSSAEAIKKLKKEFPELEDWNQGDLTDMLSSTSPTMSAKNGKIQVRFYELLRGKAACGDDVEAKYEEGKPADPTENMSPEDAAQWKGHVDHEGENLKSAALLRTVKPGTSFTTTKPIRLVKSESLQNWVWHEDAIDVPAMSFVTYVRHVKPAVGSDNLPEPVFSWKGQEGFFQTEYADWGYINDNTFMPVDDDDDRVRVTGADDHLEILATADDAKEGKFEKGKEVSLDEMPAELQDNAKNPPPEVQEVKDEISKKARVDPRWQPFFLNQDFAKAQAKKGITYLPFHELDSEGQRQARRMYPYGECKYGSKYAFLPEHYYYPTKTDGSIAAWPSAHRLLAIPKATIDNDEAMARMGYEVCPEWQTRMAGLAGETVLDQLLDMELESLDAPKLHARATSEMQAAAKVFDQEVEESLTAYLKVNQGDWHPDFAGWDPADVASEMMDDGKAAYLVYMQLDGQGVGTGDGDWDGFFKNDQDRKTCAQYVLQHARGKYNALHRTIEDAAFEAMDKAGKTASTGLYGSKKAIEGACLSCGRKLARTASAIARRTYKKAEESAPFLATHAKRAKSLPAKILVAQMRELGPKIASKIASAEAAADEAPVLGKVAGAAKHGLYGFKAKAAQAGLQAVADLRHEAGILASDLHSRRGDEHEQISAFLDGHSKEGKCMYARMIKESYPEARSRTASVPLMGGTLIWEE